MVEVQLTGWENGLQVINLVNLIKAKTGLSLQPAKNCVDLLLNDEIVVLEFADPKQADAFLKEAGSLGATAEILT